MLNTQSQKRLGFESLEPRRLLAGLSSEHFGPMRMHDAGMPISHLAEIARGMENSREMDSHAPLSITAFSHARSLPRPALPVARDFKIATGPYDSAAPSTVSSLPQVLPGFLSSASHATASQLPGGFNSDSREASGRVAIETDLPVVVTIVIKPIIVRANNSAPLPPSSNAVSLPQAGNAATLPQSTALTAPAPEGAGIATDAAMLEYLNYDSFEAVPSSIVAQNHDRDAEIANLDSLLHRIAEDREGQRQRHRQDAARATLETGESSESDPANKRSGSLSRDTAQSLETRGLSPITGDDSRSDTAAQKWLKQAGAMVAIDSSAAKPVASKASQIPNEQLAGQSGQSASNHWTRGIGLFKPMQLASGQLTSGPTWLNWLNPSPSHHDTELDSQLESDGNQRAPWFTRSTALIVGTIAGIASIQWSHRKSKNKPDHQSALLS